MNKRIVIESPLAGDHAKNFRYLLWCLRAVWRKTGHHAIASHLINPWFMDDSDQTERTAGIDNAWVWQPGVPHWFFCDLGVSGGMKAASKRCATLGLPCTQVYLRDFDPESFEAFTRGEWPPHTNGFELAHVATEDLKIIEGDLRNGTIGGAPAIREPRAAPLCVCGHEYHSHGDYGSGGNCKGAAGPYHQCQCKKWERA